MDKAAIIFLWSITITDYFRSQPLRNYRQNYSLSREMLEVSSTLLLCVKWWPVSLTLILTTVLFLTSMWYWKLQQVNDRTWGTMFIRKLYELARVTRYNGNRRQQSPQQLGCDVGDSIDYTMAWAMSQVRHYCVPEVTWLPILTIYINLLLIAGGM